MDYWQKARSFAKEAAKRTHELTKEAAKRSQDLTIGSSKISDIVFETAKRSKEIASEASKRSQDITIGSSKLSEFVSETAKRSKEIAAEASKRADQIKNEAFKKADLIKFLAEGNSLTNINDDMLERFGITEELRDFVKEITISTFQDFPLQGTMWNWRHLYSEMSDVPTVSNVRQDLSHFREKHAKLVLSSVKEISKLRYELCPRIMKERKFWQIYFMIVNNHVAPYEKEYMKDAGDKSVEVKDEGEKHPKAEITSKHEPRNAKLQSKASSAEQDLDVFLLGGDSDDGEDDGDAAFDDDFGNMVDSSDDEKNK